MERIENILDTQREVDGAALDREAAFLLEKARREPGNSRVWSLLAYMENHRADTHKRKAAEYAKESLSRRADNKAALWELVRAHGVQGPYWELADAHLSFINFLYTFVDKNPQVLAAYQWLMDALLLDNRFKEAMEVCGCLAGVEEEDDMMVPYYRGLITWKAGDREEALRIWRDMVRDLPEDSDAWGLYGEGYAMTGDYAGAAAVFEQCKKHAAPPRHTWPWEQCAYYQELAGDVEGAIQSLEELLKIRAEDFGYAGDAGEAAYRADIERLKRKL